MARISRARASRAPQGSGSSRRLLKLSESLLIHIEVPMIVPKAPDEIGEMHINLVILHLDQGFVQLVMILRFESAIPFMA